MSAPDAFTTALEAVQQFARATNLVVAGRRFGIVGEGAGADELDGILTILGARPARGDERVDHLWVLNGTAAEQIVRETAARQPDTALIVVDAGSEAPALDLARFGAQVPARPGVVGLPEVGSAVFAVPRGGGAGENDGTSTRPADPAADAAARIAWARRFMPVSAGLADELAENGDGTGLYGLRIAVAMVLEPKTAVLALLLRDAGAVVDVYAHADETDDAVAEALRREGVDVFASSTATLDEQRDLALQVLDLRPDLLLDDGSHVIRLAHELRPDLPPTMIGAAEETTSGVRPLRVMADRGELRLPVIDVNGASAKTFFDNRYGTGQSCVFAVLDVLETAPKRVRKRGSAGRTAVVAGFGHVGEGVGRALTAAGLRVVVSEVDAVRALQAAFAGYAVAPLAEAVATADLVISATGVRDTISLAALRRCKSGAVVAVAGGVDQEVAVDDALAAGATREAIEPQIERLQLADGDDDRHVFLLGEGGCINIVAGEGNPVEIMDLSFAVQLEAVRTLLDGAGRLAPGLHPVHRDADRRIAEAALSALGLASDVGADARDSGTDPDREPLDTRTTRFGQLLPPAPGDTSR
ncbi:hypothetical protein AX769_07910 [Frondihabitans sp. PAMC 28766]|uniref:adenosylhomocysteinase n=1 Tax=Frondihabitans sp. PAMC 28766 TaxID=1795630 RepID=UPI00078C354A|nr:adenosylhomocysteinase [Frondihabitans sp. PAMC 28766]AMM20103.1 hypothetical protein AX769_07910 [Frondihabitans sp. PAMC 28766]